MVAVCVTVAVLVTRGGNGDQGPDVLTIDCIGGSEKTELMADPEVTELLRSKYQLAVNFQPMGLYEQVQIPTDDLNARGIDCLWPASASAQSVFEAQHADQFPQYAVETVLRSPEVIYAGPQATDALVRAGVVTLRDGRHYADIKTLLLEYVLAHKTWEAIGGADLRGSITVASTDAARSNSGFTLAQLELNMIATDDVYRAPHAEQAQVALATIRALYDAQGLPARNPDLGFITWLQGGELAAPLYADYENQIVQYVIRAGQNTGPITDSVRMIYPDPTIYSDHPILALYHDSARLIEAMKDPEIQALAWRKYGFRSGPEVAPSNVGDFADLPLAQQIRTTAPPNAEVTLLLLGCIQDAAKCSAA